MSGRTRLSIWREIAGLSPRLAARYLRISPETYLELEAGRGEVSPALAMEIMNRTHGQVLTTDLPGCTIELVTPAISDGPLHVTSGPQPTARHPLGHHPIIGEPGGLMLGAYLSRQSGDLAVWLSLSDVVGHSGSAWAMTPEAAEALAQDLIRFAALARQPGSVPV